MASVTLPTFAEAVIAVVGVAKNCGKTTTLNALAGAARASRPVGLVSVGIDGETRDALLGTPKPPVVVGVGDLLVTTQQLLSQARIEFELVQTLGFSTPLGESVIARALTAGDVMIGGLRHRADLVRSVDAMRELGAEQVWIDGAYGRVSAADPTLCDGVVLATGAVLGRDVDTVVDATVALERRLGLDAVEEPWQVALLDAALQQRRTLLGAPDTAPIETAERSGLLAATQAKALLSRDVTAVAIPGLVSDRVLLQLLHGRARLHGRRGTLLIRDATCLQADRQLLARFEESWQVLVKKANRLLAVAYNPTSVQGYRLDAEDLGARLRAAFPNTTVFDPIVGLH